MQCDDNKRQSDRVHSYITDSHKIFYFVSEIIKASKRLLRLKLFKDHNEVKKITKHLKNVKHVRDLK